MNYFFLISFLVLLLYFLYSVLSTFLIRLMTIRLTKKLTGQNGILLTFDDGPHPFYTPQLLDLLKEHQVKAAFFVVGELVEKHPDIIQRMNEEGHTIGIHHYHHVSSWILTPWQLKRQLITTGEAITKITNEPVTYYRPPWGHFNMSTLWLSRKQHIIMWSHIFRDWKSEAHHLHLLKIMPEKGSILLLHDNGDTPGADSNAPRIMMDHLAGFMDRCEINNIEFISLKETQTSYQKEMKF